MFGAKSYSMFEIFGVAREVPRNYASRVSVDNALIDALTQDKHIVIHGSSKQGKTSLRKNTLLASDYIYVTCSNKWSLSDLHNAILKAAGYKVEGSTVRSASGALKVTATLEASLKGLILGGKASGAAEGAGEVTKQTSSAPLQLDPGDVNDIIGALNAAGAPKFIVLEDYHYLPEETQKDFAVALKAFHENSSYCFVVIGVWLDENRLTQYNGDLLGRVVSINADSWNSEELREVISAGGEMLNVEFPESFVSALLSGSFDSVWIVQEVCKFACEGAGVYETGKTRRSVGGNVDALIRRAVDQNTARFSGFLSGFADGFQSTDLQMYRWLIYTVLRSDVSALEKGLPLAAITTLINEGHPSAPVNQGNITQALRSTSSLQTSRLDVKPIVLDYHQTARRLNVVDRSFLIWIQHQDRAELAAELGLPWTDQPLFV
jgi:hypothetical protein